MAGQTLAIANNAIAYIWWRLDAKIDGCLGFRYDGLKRMAIKRLYRHLWDSNPACLAHLV